MTFWERVFHAALFEFFAILLTVAVMTNATEHSAGLWTGVIVGISCIAMLWNMLFNWICDKLFPGERLDRSFIFRLMHTLCFEGGLLFFTLPLVAYALNVDLWTAFLMDISMTLIVMGYSLLYNWAYDYLRDRLIKWRGRYKTS